MSYLALLPTASVERKRDWIPGKRYLRVPFCSKHLASFLSLTHSVVVFEFTPYQHISI